MTVTTTVETTIKSKFLVESSIFIDNYSENGGAIYVYNNDNTEIRN